MTSYLKKYVTSLASAKDFIAQWSSDHVYADEALIVPFPTLAIYDPARHVWLVQIRAWLYLPFEGKKLKIYLPSLSKFITGKSRGIKNKESIDEDDKKVDADKKITAAVAIEDNNKREKQEESPDDDDDEIDGDIYEDALHDDELDEPEKLPGRLGLFFVGNSVKVVTKSIINGVEHLLQPSDESGFIDEQIEIPEKDLTSLCATTHPESTDRKFEYEIQINQPQTDIKDENYKAFKCTIYVLASQGVSIISDIDDTIKISKVLNTRALLKHTFYSYFKPVEGMNELYQKWYEQKCQFHYVSASPWQLYPALRCFLEKYKYPMGTMNLRKFTWSLKFFKPADTYKIETITQIINAYPLRKYICVGDSGELDPEIYSKLYKTFSKNIAHIFIRDICRLPACLPSCGERYVRAFEDIPKERWTIFKDPKKIEENIEKINSCLKCK